MENNKVLSYIHIFMCGLNFIIIYFIAWIMSRSIIMICRGMEAKEFLSRLTVIPSRPGQIMWMSMTVYLLLLGVIYIRAKLPKAHEGYHIWLAVLEILFCIVIMRSIDMSYSGVVLLVIADLVQWFQSKRQKVLFFICMISLYIISDYNVIESVMPMAAFDDFLFYYNIEYQGILKGIKSALTSVNVMAFILYVVILIQTQLQENERIRSLNEQLNTANEQLQVMNGQLKVYAMESEKMAETRERNRLAREIHDTLGHALTGICAGIDACLALIDCSPEMTKQQLNRIGDVARQGIKDVRRSVSKLRPDALERLSLREALEQMVLEMRQAANTQIGLNIQVETLKFNADEEDMVYRIVQEGITNAVRHGKASRIDISITKKDEWLTLMIQDNGIGCSNIAEGFGLRHMQERIALLNGTIEYNGENGFTVIARIPIRWGEDYD